MAIMDANYDQEMMRLWGIISDLSEQLNQHRATASALRNQAEGIKVSFRHRVNITRSLCWMFEWLRATQSTAKRVSCYAGMGSCPVSGFKPCSPYER